MKDPERLFDAIGTPEARLLGAVMDEPVPAGVLERTLAAVGTGAAVGAASSAVAATKVGAKLAFVHGTGGLAAAIGVGTILGLATLGAIAVGDSASTAPIASSSMAAVARAADRPEPSIVTSRAVSASADPTAEPEPMAPPPPAARVAPSGVAPAAPASSTRSLTTEIALLDEARSALRAGDRARARRVMDRYAREVPRGQLSREAALVRARLAEDGADAGAEPNP